MHKGESGLDKISTALYCFEVSRSPIVDFRHKVYDYANRTRFQKCQVSSIAMDLMPYLLIRICKDT